MKMKVVGIYGIEDIETGNIYVGQSKDIAKRWSNHASFMKNNEYRYEQLQDAYNADCKRIKYTILEECNASELKDREDFWIKHIQRQVKYIIQDKFRDKNNKAVREISLTVDFVLELNTDEIIMIDCKGCKETIEETFKIKWKMMKLKYPEYDYKVVVWDKKVKEFVEI